MMILLSSWDDEIIQQLVMDRIRFIDYFRLALRIGCTRYALELSWNHELAETAILHVLIICSRIPMLVLFSRGSALDNLNKYEEAI